MTKPQTSPSLEAVLTSIEDKLTRLESQKAEIDRAIAIKRDSIKQMREALDHLLALEAKIQKS